MTALYIVLTISLLAAVAIWRLQRGSVRPIRSWDELMGQTKPVDLKAFQNLIANDATLFLTQSLRGAAFRHVQRLRHRAAIAYLQTILHNSSILASAGELAAASDNDDLARAGERLVELALVVRVRALRMMMRLWAEMVWPAGQTDVTDALRQYGELKEAFRRLGTLRDPVWTGQISATL